MLLLARKNRQTIAIGNVTLATNNRLKCACGYIATDEQDLQDHYEKQHPS